MKIVVIQCAATKRAGAGHLVASDGRAVQIVARPRARATGSYGLFARPDDMAESSCTWRDILAKYNAKGSNDPLGLSPAYRLYSHPIYERLAKFVGLQNFFVLSAGRGLMSAEYLIPHYDITFSASADDYKRRRRGDRYLDFCMMPSTVDAEIIFFGGKDYLPLFCKLTAHITGNKTVYYNSSARPNAPGCKLVRFDTTTRTNWHYECAQAYIAGALL